MATGVLVLAVGEGTKLVNHLMAGRKRYAATVKLGQSTATLDAEGVIDDERSVPALSLAQVRAQALGFLGDIEQVVPAVSAIKVDGRPLYERARKGQVVDAPTRRVHVHSLEILAVRPHEIELSVSCSKGFYVRSLARDLAAALGTVGHLTALRRLENGPFGVGVAVDFERLRAARDNPELRDEIRKALMPLPQVARALSHVVLSDAGARHAFHGRLVPRSEVIEETRAADEEGPIVVAFDQGGKVLALVAPDESGDSLRVVRGVR